MHTALSFVVTFQLRLLFFFSYPSPIFSSPSLSLSLNFITMWMCSIHSVAFYSKNGLRKFHQQKKTNDDADKMLKEKYDAWERERENFAKSFLLPSDDSEENPVNSLILLCCLAETKTNFTLLHRSLSFLPLFSWFSFSILIECENIQTKRGFN